MKCNAEFRHGTFQVATSGGSLRASFVLSGTQFITPDIGLSVATDMVGALETTTANLPSVSKTVTILVPTAKEPVFDFISDIENLPGWATEFCRGLKREGAYHKVVTSMGELFFRIESDRKTGVIDMFAGPTAHGPRYLPPVV